MQAHALTPRLVAALETNMSLSHSWQSLSTEPAQSTYPIHVKPDFPFLSVLASGGHTLLIHSAALTEHRIMGSTSDSAIGDCLDKIARLVLPIDVLQETKNIMYGAMLENFAFSQDRHLRSNEACTSGKPIAQTQSGVVFENDSARQYRQKYEAYYTYRAPKNQEEAFHRNVSRWGWSFNQPLAKGAGCLKNNSLEMSFSGLTAAVQRAIQYEFDQSTGKLTKIERSPKHISLEERRDMAQCAMRAAFEHLAGRVALALRECPVSTVVMAGGVAANSYLRYILASILCANGHDEVKLVFPPPSLCCDNAAMIAWAGIEMYQTGTTDQLNIRAVRKWPLDQLLSPPMEKTT